MIYNSLEIPMFALSSNTPEDSDTITQIEKAAAKNRESGYSSSTLNAIEGSAFMWAAVNTETCLRRSTSLANIRILYPTWWTVGVLYAL